MMQVPKLFPVAATLAVTGVVLRFLSYYWAGNSPGNAYVVLAYAFIGVAIVIGMYSWFSQLLSAAKETSKASSEGSVAAAFEVGVHERPSTAASR